MKRRQFIQASTALAMSSVFPTYSVFGAQQASNNIDLDLNVFSKHLQFLNYADMADAAANIGFTGVDLTVRPKGHVLPERVIDDLPKAVEGLKSADLTPNMMTTAITHADQKHTLDILQQAGMHGFEVYRMGYYRFPQNPNVPQLLKGLNKNLNQLAAVNQQAKIKGAYQNHAGANFVGAQVWDIWHMLDGIDSDHMGCQYDIRHASVEGAQSWPVTFNMLRKTINSLVLKDYKWQKQNGKWTLQNVPIGQGMVDFKHYFAVLKKLNIIVPVSVHFEYDLGGAEHGATKISGSSAQVFSAMKRDLKKIKQLWQDA
ncbi:sugar phosphate isomerase/epimerase family protein [Paraglaciecola sp.]|uniref:sugar phosphate isomerase/epimerase family protein n=1 Tax=Paraglaciecola sp. TaxID=1920173 RepID=UPI003EF18EA9